MAILFIHAANYSLSFHIRYVVLSVYHSRRWSLIAGRLPERTDNEIKNYWNTHLSKKLLLMNQSSTTATNLKRRSKSPSIVQNHVLNTGPVKKTTVVTQSQMVRSNSFNVYGCSNRDSRKGFKSCNVKETMNSSKLFFDLIAGTDLITNNDSQPIESKESRNSTASMSSLVESGRSPDSDSCGGDATSLAESLVDLNELSTPDCNLLSYPSEFCTDFGLQEFYTEPATLAAEAIFELDFNGNTQDLDWIFELDYTQK